MLSVVIATENAERTLVPTLAALVPGAMAGLVREVIVADAGSSDATAIIADAAGCRIDVTQAPRGERLRQAEACGVFASSIPSASASSQAMETQPYIGFQITYSRVGLKNGGGRLSEPPQTPIDSDARCRSAARHRNTPITLLGTLTE